MSRAKTRNLLKSLYIYTGVAVVMLSILIPFGWMVSGSFKSLGEIQAADVKDPAMSPRWIPREPILENYTHITEFMPIWRYFKNSLIISIGTMLLCCLLSIFAGYALSRFSFRGKGAYTFVLLTTQMFPGILFLIPYFVMFNIIKNTLGIQMSGTYWGMIITYSAFALPFSILMMKNYFSELPKDLDEQAQIDGCTQFQALWKILIPLAVPGIVAVGIYAFIMAWNEVLFASVLTNMDTKTVSIGLIDFITGYKQEWGKMMAACIVVSIPVLVLFTFMQKYIIEGLVAGATKG